MKIKRYPKEQCVRIEISNQKQYREVLKKIQEPTQKIIIVQIDGFIKDDPIVNTAWNILHLEKKEIVNEWYGTIAESSRDAVKYTFNVIHNKNRFFNFLYSLNSFWDGIETVADKCDIQSNFDDIAFLDDKSELLFYSTTHEGDFFISKDLV